MCSTIGVGYNVFTNIYFVQAIGICGITYDNIPRHKDEICISPTIIEHLTNDG